jgi:hypothetical protein
VQGRAPHRPSLRPRLAIPLPGVQPRRADGGRFTHRPSVYLSKYSGKSFYSKLTSQITTLQNNVGGAALGIDPHWAIPIDVGNDGDTNFFAFVAFGTCNNGAGLVDVIHDSTCSINRDGVDYANWAAMVAANPNDHVSYADFAFIIADGSGDPGPWTVNNVKVGTNT